MAEERELDRGTRIRSDDDGRLVATLVDGWDMRGVPNGGYVLTAIGRALGHAVGLPDPVALTAHYLAPTAPGELELRVEVGREGRRHGTAAVTALQETTPVVQAVGTFGDLSAPGDHPHAVTAEPPRLPDPDDCDPRRGLGAAGIGGRVDLRLHPEDAGFNDGTPSGRPLLRGWARLADGGEPDTLALLLLADVFPPAVFNTGLPVSWVPTLQMSVHVRARPAPGWIRGVFRSRVVQGGYLEEDGELWDAEDRLVAQSRQLALVPRSG